MVAAVLSIRLVRLLISQAPTYRFSEGGGLLTSTDKYARCCNIALYNYRRNREIKRAGHWINGLPLWGDHMGS